MTSTAKQHAIDSLHAAASAAYVLGVTSLAVLLGLTGSGSTALWIVLFAVTAPCSFVLAPAAAVLMVGLGASFGAASSFVVQALMATLWVASWSGIAAVNVALIAPGRASRLRLPVEHGPHPQRPEPAGTEAPVLRAVRVVQV